MRKHVFKAAFGLLLLATLSASAEGKKNAKQQPQQPQKEVVYQVFTRLFGNKNTTNKPWGTVQENGVGKFNDFTDKALKEIKGLGATYIWYTGVPHHALVNDFTAFGISNDDPDVVKGRAGSPYAVKDYYNVNPDLAVNPAKRLDEFKALIKRTHKNGLKVIIDIVPNHVARSYKSTVFPDRDFGKNDNKGVEYSRNNNFYYIPGKAFEVPEWRNGYKPLGGEIHPLADGKFDENPAKWTGNGSRLARPDFYDWYETVKINYGVRPDGTKDFPELPNGFDKLSYKEHFAFWKGKSVPDSWVKFRDIALYWLDMGVDGFRFDMAEMVPVEFWSFMNSSIKMKKPSAFLLAEVYNPKEYRNYILKGKMDYLYDKVELYDTLKNIIQGRGNTDHIAAIQNGLADIEHHMLHFLENHDEQRIASPEFAGNAVKGKPMMVISATISTSPTMIYFGQEVGEAGALNSGFGSHSRTSIFDYAGVPNHQRWMNNGSFDGGKLSNDEKELRTFYKKLLQFTTKSSALAGSYEEIHFANRKASKGYDGNIFSFVRWSSSQKLVVVSNLDASNSRSFELIVPASVISKWGLKDGAFVLNDALYGKKASLVVANGVGKIAISISPLESFIYEL